MNHFLTTSAAWNRRAIRLLYSSNLKNLKQVRKIHQNHHHHHLPIGGGFVNNKNEDHTKQHFDDIYVAENPVPYKEHILDALQYVSDDFNKSEFDRLILPWALERTSQANTTRRQGDNGGDNDNDEPVATTPVLEFVDLGACFGNTTMATLYGMSCEAIRDNWASAKKCMAISSRCRRRFPAKTTAIDISESALSYGKNVGLYDDTIVANVNAMTGETRDLVMAALAAADILISAAALVYFDSSAIEEMIDVFCNVSNKEEGYVLVNFLHPFGLEKSDVTKRLLLSKLDFVGSRASRHRRLSTLEQTMYTGEEWVLLEIWVLKRRVEVERKLKD
jgi:hypothetical protein